MKKLPRLQSIMPCALCGSDKGLYRSHIIPKFVIKWFIDTSPTGYLRRGENINIRQQDSQKEKLLCLKCENKFCQVEKIFAEKVFLPFHKNEIETIEYDEWLYKFVVSISWRVLKSFEDETTKESHFAMELWSNYLTDNVDNKDLYQFEHHIIFLGPLDINGSDKPKVRNINKYLIRAIDAIPLFGNNTLVVYTKMCRIVVLSLFNISTDKFFNTRIRKGKGILTINQTIMDPAFSELLEKGAKRVDEIYQQMSEKQKKKVLDTAKEDLNRFFDSEWYYAEEKDHKLNQEK